MDACVHCRAVGSRHFQANARDGALEALSADHRASKGHRVLRGSVGLQSCFHPCLALTPHTFPALKLQHCTILADAPAGRNMLSAPASTAAHAISVGVAGGKTTHKQQYVAAHLLAESSHAFNRAWGQACCRQEKGVISGLHALWTGRCEESDSPKGPGEPLMLGH